MELTEEVKALVLNPAKDLKGSTRRIFMARTVQAWAKAASGWPSENWDIIRKR